MKLYLPLSLVFFSCTPSYAQHTIHLGGGGLNYQLTENDLYTHQQLVKESGTLIGLVYGLDYPFNHNLMLHAQAQQSYGIIDYDGQTQTGIPHQTETTHFVNQGSASLGYLILANSEVYIGIHGQQDMRDVANRNGVYGATELYTELFAKIGIKQGFKLNNKNYVSALAESYKPFFAESFVDSRVNDDVTISLKKGSASAWGLRYIYQYNPQYGVFVNYSDFRIRYKNSSRATQTIYGQPTGSYLYQPPIQFKQQTVAVGLTWQFD